MIVYEADKATFVKDVRAREIAEKIETNLKDKLGRKTAESEVASWRNSLKDMRDALDSDDIPSDARVAIEYQIPNTSKRVDFLISGLDEEYRENVVIVELKQWQKAKKTNRDGIVVTRFQRGEAEVAHPSYQAWTYASLIRDFNHTVQEEEILLSPCAFLHNYPTRPSDPLKDPFYAQYLKEAPLFTEKEIDKLERFIQRYVKYGDDRNILYRIDRGKIKPSKNLAENVGSMLKGNEEFLMVDDQKVVYEKLYALSIKADRNHGRKKDKKHVVIVKGGPGTGKSVIAVNLLAKLITRQINARYITRNAAPREVYSALLKGSFTKSYVDNLFSSSGSFHQAERNEFPVLVVDEAHRLNEKSGMFSNLGENQMKELIHAANLSVFFIDEAQTVTLKDKGSIHEIRQWATHYQADVTEMSLESQFRCNGSDGYLAWIDNLLEIRPTANEMLDTRDFDFRVVDDPNELRDLIFEKNKIRNRARLLAGYCWDWEKEKRDDSNHHDIVISEHNFGMSWNLGKDGLQWLIKPNSVNEVGCIHTSQGLELDYVGVIIGDDLRYEDGSVLTDVSKRAKTDQSVKGSKKGMKENPDYMKKKVDEIIKNTYRTLLTRGMKGCYIYCTDKKLQRYISSKLYKDS